MGWVTLVVASTLSGDHDAWKWLMGAYLLQLSVDCVHHASAGGLGALALWDARVAKEEGAVSNSACSLRISNSTSRALQTARAAERGGGGVEWRGEGQGAHQLRGGGVEWREEGQGAHQLTVPRTRREGEGGIKGRV